MKLKHYTFITALSLGLLLGGNLTHAQVGADPTDLSVILLPKTPTSFSNTTIRLENFATNLDAADIRWLVNGKEADRGVGKKELLVRTGAVGIATVVKVTVRPQEGGVIEKTITLNPAEVDLLWQAETYTPVFYKGKALASSESLVTIVASPIIKVRGVTISPKNLVYRWKKDNKAILAQSGFGKNTFTFEKELLKESTNILVEVSTQDGNTVVEKTLVISDFSPEIHFYEEDALSGTNYSRALDDGASLTTSEGTVRAEPYYVEGRTPSSFISSVWSINNTKVPADPQSPFVMTLRSEENRGGVAFVGLSLEHTSKLLQNAKNSFSITLGR